MTDHDLPPELQELESGLQGLTPAPHLIDGNAIVFEAGRQSVMNESGNEISATPKLATTGTGNSIRTHGALRFTLLGSVLGTAATILVMLGIGLLNMSQSSPGPSPDTIAESAGSLQPGLASDDFKGSGTGPGVIENDSIWSAQRDQQGVATTNRLFVHAAAEGEVLTTTGFRAGSNGNRSSSDPNKSRAVSNTSSSLPGNSTYWQLNQQLLRGRSM